MKQTTAGGSRPIAQRHLTRVALGFGAIACALSLLPTWPLRFSDGKGSIVATERHLWLDPQTFGSGDVLAPLACLLVWLAAAGTLLLELQHGDRGTRIAAAAAAWLAAGLLVAQLVIFVGNPDWALASAGACMSVCGAALSGRRNREE